MITREVIKKRKISVKGIDDTAAGRKLGEMLKGLRGITSVEVFLEGDVSLEYDLAEISLEMIEERIIGAGFGLNEGRLGRLKRSFLYYSEKNEYDNMNVEPRKCCSSIPGDVDSCETCAHK